MRVVRGLIIAVASAALAGGCNRQKGAGGASAGAAKQAGAALPAAVDQKSPASKSPAEQLFQAIRISPDQKKVIQLLTEHPELLNKEINGASPLRMACESRSLPLVKAVLERGADLKGRNANRQTVLWAAVSYDSLPIVKYLIERGADPKVLQDDGDTLLWGAETREMAEFLIAQGVDPKQKNENGDMALHQACRHSVPAVVELLLDKGLDIEAKGHWDMRPLHSSASTLTGDPRPVVELLLKRGANIDSRGFHGHTAIHECALFNRIEMAEMLLARGAQPDLKDDEGRTPMDTLFLPGKVDSSSQIARILMNNVLVKYGAPGVLIQIPNDR